MSKHANLQTPTAITGFTHVMATHTQGKDRSQCELLGQSGVKARMWTPWSKPASQKIQCSSSTQNLSRALSKGGCDHHSIVLLWQKEWLVARNRKQKFCCAWTFHFGRKFVKQCLQRATVAQAGLLCRRHMDLTNFHLPDGVKSNYSPKTVLPPRACPLRPAERMIPVFPLYLLAFIIYWLNWLLKSRAASVWVGLAHDIVLQGLHMQWAKSASQSTSTFFLSEYVRLVVVAV